MKVALLSDIHANIFALKAVYADLEKEKVDHILVAGDLIGYYYWPKEVVKILRNDNRVLCVRGNHEEILKEALISESKRSYYRKKYGNGYDVCREVLSVDEIEWLLALPNFLEVELDNCSFYITHGSLQNINEYIYPDSELDRIRDNYSECQVTVFGHTHHPFIHTKDNKVIINPGSVGQPRDKGGLASYAIIDTENMVVRFKRSQFDYSKLVETSSEKNPDLKYLWKVMYR